MFNILLDKGCKPDEVYLSNHTLRKLNINSKVITLHFGTFTKNLKIIINYRMELGRVIISNKLSPDFIIPDLPYEYKFNRNHLYLGPVIGFLVVPYYFANPHRLSLRFINYQRIRGLIVLFGSSSVNTKNKTISGKYFDPLTKRFINGIFPYPSAIYSRVPLLSKTYNHFTKHIGNNIFNYPFFNTNKLSFWHWMSKEPSICEHLPQTAEFTGIESLLQPLNKFSSVYLKPTSLSQGTGIFHVMKSGTNYLLSDRFGNKYSYKTPAELAQALREKLLPKRKYIVQQPIPFTNYKGNKIDFRVYIQKDYSGHWKLSGVETKVAKKGSIISNSKNREQIVPGQKALASFFGMDEAQIKVKMKEIAELGIKVLLAMEKHSGHLGDAAVDMVLDNNHKVWILEVQLNYAGDMKALRSADEHQVLPAVLPTPLEYARHLAGF